MDYCSTFGRTHNIVTTKPRLDLNIAYIYSRKRKKYSENRKNTFQLEIQKKRNQFSAHSLLLQ